MKTLRNRLKKFRAGLFVSAACVLAVSNGEAQAGHLSSWKTLADGGAQVEIEQVAAAPPLLDGQSTNALQIVVKQTGKRFGIVCADMGQMKLQPGEWYDVSFNARTDSGKTYALIFSLESTNGKTVGARTTLPEVGHANWAHYNVALHIRLPVSKCRMVIALADAGSISLNDISVVLRKNAAKN
jgi:hypothetical protein